jgi:integrase
VAKGEPFATLVSSAVTRALPRSVVKRRLHPLLERLGIPRCGLHGFRHANSSLMDRLNTPMKVRQQRLGHSDPRTTLGTYTHVASEDDRRVAEQLGAILHRVAPKLEESGITIGEQSPFVSVG